VAISGGDGVSALSGVRRFISGLGIISQYSWRHQRHPAAGGGGGVGVSWHQRRAAAGGGIASAL